MRALRAFLKRLGALFGRERWEQDSDAEVASNIALHTDDNIRSGMDPDTARRAAVQKFGNAASAKDHYRDRKTLPSLDSLLQDVRFALRSLTKSPGFSAVVVGALALAIGASTIVFSVMNAVLFQPLPYPDPNRIVATAMRFTNIGADDDRNYTSAPEFEEMVRYQNAFSHLSAYFETSASMRVGEMPERYRALIATPGYFDVLGVSPALGRAFLAEEGSEGRDDVVVLSHGLWQARFGGDPSILGRGLNINGRPMTVIGVMPAGFADPSESDLWAPLAFTAEQLSNSSRGSHFLRVLARIRPDLSFAQAEADMQRVSERIVEENPQYDYRGAGFRVMMFPLLEETVGQIRPALWLMLGAVGLVLLIACANVANLMMARASMRQKEIGVRAALGAGRMRLVRQLLTESMVLAASGAAAGVLLAWIGVSAVTGFAGDAFPRLAGAGLDLTTFGFTATVAATTALLFGILPALQVSQVRTSESLQDGGRSNTAGSHSQALRRVLVVAEVALSLALLAGAGLLLKSFMRIQQIDPGYQPDNVLTFRVVLPEARYDDDSKVRAFYTRLLDQVRAMPGILSAGAINGLPLSGNGGSGTTTMDTTALPPDDTSVEAERRYVTPGYFQTMGTRLIDGRYFTEADNETGERVAIVDQTLADTYWPGESAVGKRLHFGGMGSSNPWMRIVGVVQHTRFQSIERPSRVEVFVPHAQVPVSGLNLVLKTAADPATFIPAMRSQVIGLDPEQPIHAVFTMRELMADSLLRRQLILILLGAFSAVALSLAALGIYGMLSYWVTQRYHEIGIRMALGASRSQVLGMVAAQSLLVVSIGAAGGLAASVLLMRLLEAMLFDVTATDPATLAAVTLTLIAVGLLASLVPAWRAARVDPIDTLRYG